MSDEEERWRNYALYKVYATDEEMGFIGLVCLGLAVAAAVAYGLVWLFHYLGGGQ